MMHFDGRLLELKDAQVDVRHLGAVVDPRQYFEGQLADTLILDIAHEVAPFSLTVCYPLKFLRGDFERGRPHIDA